MPTWQKGKKTRIKQNNIKTMNKKIKWVLITLLVIALGIFGFYQLTPHKNTELSAADTQPKQKARKVLNVNALVVTPHTLTDEIQITGRLVPDEEVELSFETSGKITNIFFTEGSYVKKGELLAKVNDSHRKRVAPSLGAPTVTPITSGCRRSCCSRPAWKRSFPTTGGFFRSFPPSAIWRSVRTSFCINAGKGLDITPAPAT